MKEKTRSVLIKVGMAWPKTAPKDERYAMGEPWPTIQKLVSEGVSAAKKRVDCEGEVARLKAPGGGATLEGIVSAIEDADILVFDVSPDPKIGSGKPFCNQNVLLEIGIALGMKKPVLLIGSGSGYLRTLPSDMKSMIIAQYSSPPKLGKVSATGSGATRQTQASRTGNQSIRATIQSMIIVAANSSPDVLRTEPQRHARRQTRLALATSGRN